MNITKGGNSSHRTHSHLVQGTIRREASHDPTLGVYQNADGSLLREVVPTLNVPMLMILWTMKVTTQHSDL
jgi:hypothetical protein